MPDYSRLDVSTISRPAAARKGGLRALMLIPALLGGSSLAGAQTPAGTVINNIAHVSYDLDSAHTDLASNRVDVRVDELIDFTVEPAPVCSVPVPAGDMIAIGFRLTNRGNGSEAFVPGTPLVTGDSNFKAEAVAQDSNGDGCYQPGADAVIAPGDSTTPLAPGQSTTIFVTGRGWSGTGKVTLPIRSKTGTGTAGTAFVGDGDGGSDAVMGATGGVSNDVPGAAPEQLQASLVKSHSILAPDGSDKAMRGATITYSIEARFTGGGTATDVVVADNIPAGTTYVPGTIVLDGAALSDGADGDRAKFDGTGIAVALGDVPAPATHVISFKVRINGVSK